MATSKTRIPAFAGMTPPLPSSDLTRGSTRHLHVLLVITKGEIGGAQTHVIELCRALRGQVCFSAVIGGDDGTFLEQALRELGVQTTTLPALRNSLNPLRIFGSVRALLAQLRTQPPDLIHVHSAVAGVVARLAGKLRGIPVVYTVHGFGFKPQAPAPIRLNAWLAEAVPLHRSGLRPSVRGCGYQLHQHFRHRVERHRQGPEPEA